MRDTVTLDRDMESQLIALGTIGVPFGGDSTFPISALYGTLAIRSELPTIHDVT